MRWGKGKRKVADLGESQIANYLDHHSQDLRYEVTFDDANEHITHDSLRFGLFSRASKTKKAFSTDNASERTRGLLR